MTGVKELDIKSGRRAVTPKTKAILRPVRGKEKKKEEPIAM